MSDIKEFYESDASKYDEKRFRSDYGLFTDRVQQYLLLTYLRKLKNNSKILEVGCGTGRFSLTISNEGYHLTSLDVAENMLYTLKKKMGKNKDAIDLINANADRLPFSDGKFDACISINVFSHLEHPSLVLAEISRVLKKNGSVLINIPNLFSPYFLVGTYVNIKNKSIQENVFTRWYNPKEFLKIIEDNNLMLKKVNGHLITTRDYFPLINKLIIYSNKFFLDSYFKKIAGSLYFELEKKSF